MCSRSEHTPVTSTQVRSISPPGPQARVSPPALTSHHRGRLPHHPLTPLLCGLSRTEAARACAAGSAVRGPRAARGCPCTLGLCQTGLCTLPWAGTWGSLRQAAVYRAVRDVLMWWEHLLGPSARQLPKVAVASSLRPVPCAARGFHSPCCHPLSSACFMVAFSCVGVVGSGCGADCQAWRFPGD